MCGRYRIAEEGIPEEMEDILEKLGQKKTPEDLKTSGEIFPTDIVPVLANSRRQDVQPFAMRWGYSFPGGKPIINARSETAEEKPMFRNGMQQRRCLVPASDYFEWQRKPGGSTKYAIRPERAQMLYLAGIYHLENHDGVIVPAFAILTRDAAPGISFIHHRMPVILPPQQASRWLNPENKAADVLQSALLDMEYKAMEPAHSQCEMEF